MAPERDVLVYIVDDDAPVRRSLAALLGAHGFATATCDSARSFLEIFEPARRACLMLDVRMPGITGLDLQAQLAKAGHRLPIIILTGHGDVPMAVRAMRAGALDFIEKPASERDLLAALSAAEEALQVTPRPGPSPEIVQARLDRLTRREREVLDHLILGRTNKEIASLLGISQRTVEIHRSRVREKMEARNLADLIQLMR